MRPRRGRMRARMSSHARALSPQLMCVAVDPAAPYGRATESNITIYLFK